LPEFVGQGHGTGFFSDFFRKKQHPAPVPPVAVKDGTKETGAGTRQTLENNSVFFPKKN
jgi:hypothetical protein